MRSAIEHCENQIAKLRAEIERRKAVGHSNDEYQRRLKTIEALRALHAAENNRSDDAALEESARV